MASPKKNARVTGVLYLFLLPFGFFSFVIVPSKIIIHDDISQTIKNIMENEWLFRLSTISHLISQVIVVFLALSMFRLFRNVNRNRALLMLTFALLVVPISFLNEVHNLAIIKIVHNELNGFTTGQINIHALLFLDMSRNGVLIAQIFWGLWLLPLGMLVYKSGFLPKLLGIFAIIAGVAYLFDSITQLLFSDFFLVSQFTFLFEIILPIWLLVKGVSNENWNNSSTEIQHHF